MMKNNHNETKKIIVNLWIDDFSLYFCSRNRACIITIRA